AITMAALSAVSLYADDVVNNDTVLLNGSSGNADVVLNNGSGDTRVSIPVDSDDTETEPEDTEDTEDSSLSESESESIQNPPQSSDTSQSSQSDSSNTPAEPDNDVHFNETSAGILKGYMEMPAAPSSLKGSSISTFESNMRCVSVTGENISGATNDITIYMDTITGEMQAINGKARAYALLLKFDNEATISTVSGYTLTTTDRNDGSAWKTANAGNDGYQYIVVWLNANTPTTAITFNERKMVNGRWTDTRQKVTVIRRDTTPIDPSITTPPETTTSPEDLVSELTTDWPLKTTVTDRRGTVDLSGYRLMVDPCNEIFLNASSRFPTLVSAIKDDKAFTYEIELERGNVARDVTGSFKVTMALPEKMKSSKDVYLYKASSTSYSSIEIVNQTSGEVSFVTYELGMRVIISTVNLNGYVGETTTGTGTGTASPVITAGSGSALSGAEIQVFSNATLPNGTRLQITALNTAQSNNRAVELAISEGKALPYDISLVNSSGVAVSQTGINAVSVSFNIPTQFSGITPLYVYRRESDDTFTNMNALINGGKISFVTQHLSTYIVSTVAFDGSSVSTDNAGNVVTTTKKPTNNGGGNGGGNQVTINGGGSGGADNQPTGFLFALIPVGIAAAGIAVTRKKKR
ncbi:MAG: hypothetical protein NC203_07655, partial [Firmicutes bacterium]|nr:hypothetical protein [Bacillota bacterium]